MTQETTLETYEIDDSDRRVLLEREKGTKLGRLTIEVEFTPDGESIGAGAFEEYIRELDVDDAESVEAVVDRIFADVTASLGRDSVFTVVRRQSGDGPLSDERRPATAKTVRRGEMS
ncbi:hypothetical protein Z052_01890 [Halorubrum sp. C191]|uniref:hypothetical protein n=1 Tax=Halorubrum sp. C191 TaxID=1383842 RepID=UPI000C07FD86|nr:hypothetical protein [Halorubrum sp. C191]PHQ43914.1 hypothetical protein Z052_01890 [Halorubrum sp. C191]